MIDPGLKDRVVVITGGNHGIGAATARAFAAQGTAVFINFLGVPSPDEVIAAIRKAGGQAEATEADLANIAVVPQLFDRAEEVFGPVEILVNNAAHYEYDTLLPVGSNTVDEMGRRRQTITADTHDRHLAVNSRAPALMMAEYARRHIARGGRWGRIINVSTESAPGGNGEVSYWASKNALESFSRSAADELAKYGVTVNIVAPGPIQTGWIPKEKEPDIAARIPLGRVGRPEDVSDVILFLASQQARWLTGQTVFVGGGTRVI